MNDELMEQLITEELEAVLDEKRKKKKKKKAKKKDACYRKVKARYKVWPSAYASGALVQCRKKGAKNWGNKSKKKNEGLNEEEESPLHKVAMALDAAGGAADFEKLEKVTKLSRKEIQDVKLSN